MLGLRGGGGHQRRQHEGERDERQVSDYEVRRRVQGAGREVTDVRALPDQDALVRAQRPRQLAVADVDGVHGSSAAYQQHLREAARAGTGIQADATTDPRREATGGQGVQGAVELAGPSPHPAVGGLGLGHQDRGRRVDLRGGLLGPSTADAHPPGRDELPRVLAAAGQATPHELDVETTSHARSVPWEPAEPAVPVALVSRASSASAVASNRPTATVRSSRSSTSPLLCACMAPTVPVGTARGRDHPAAGDSSCSRRASTS